MTAIETGKNSRIDGTGLTLTGPGVGFSYGKIKIDGMTASGYTKLSIATSTIDLRHASLTGGASGTVGAKRVTLTDSVVTGHTGTAIQASRIRLVRSSVTGNGLDLEAERAPKLKLSTCETSNGWGVCSND